MNKLITLTLVGVTALTVGCGRKVEVPPASIGKVITNTGMEEGLKHPSSFRLPFSFMYKPKLVLAQVSDTALEESLKVFIPKDKLNLDVDLRGTVSISSDPANVNLIFQKITPVTVQGAEHKLIIDSRKVYDTYAKQVIRSVGRSVLTKYTIAEIMENRDSISAEIFKDAREKLKTSPIQISRLGLADIQPPQVIVSAQETAKEREIQIMRAEADKQIALANAQAKLEVAKKQQEVDLIEAETQVLVEQKLAESVNQAFVTQRGLRILENIVDDSESKVIFLPYEAMQNPSLMIGGINNAINTKSVREAK